MIRSSQVLLLVVIASTGLYVTRLANAFRDRVLFSALAVIGALLIMAPETTNMVAARLGIGRGADLIFYLFILFALFAFARLVIEIRSLQRSVRLLTQEIALRGPTGDRPVGPPPLTHASPPAPNRD